ncbi:MAG: hypothetical protein DHS20C15_15570 [Planctomycetota bacterium]|nr:MAG: hypothetical protein DHS20C15_15570 [Planctomycetota bacterium]
MLRALVLFSLFAALAPAAVSQSFLYALNERGKLSVDGTVLETLPGKFTPADEQDPNGEHRWTAIAAHGPDRYSLRVDGLMQLNGEKFANLPFTLLVTDTPFWLQLDVTDDGVFALSTDGLIARDGVADDDISPQGSSFFFDLAAVGDEVYTLRFDGAVFLDGGPARGFQLRGSLDPDPKDPEVDPPTDDGGLLTTLWIRLVRDPLDDTLLALRADGVVFRLDPADFDEGADPEDLDGGEEIARFPVANLSQQQSLYVDLEVDTDGTLYALRADGSVFTLDDEDEPLVDYPPMNFDEDDDYFVDLAVLDGEFWAVRWDGVLFEGEDTEAIIDLTKKRYTGLAVSDELPNLENFDERKPVTARFKTRAVEGSDIQIPVLVTDIDEPSGEGITLTAEPLKKTPKGMSFDAETGMLSWPNAGPKGSYKIRILVQEDDVTKPRKVKFSFKILPPDENELKNKPPLGVKVSKLQALVGIELAVPILTADRDGDDVTVTIFDESKGVFALGAEYDAETSMLLWTPEFDHIGKHKAAFRLDDGTKTKKLTLTINVVNPLPFGV